MDLRHLVFIYILHVIREKILGHLAHIFKLCNKHSNRYLFYNE